MSVLYIRKHRRFAVCQPARLVGEDARTARGLLIELSRGGGRLSGMEGATFPFDDTVALCLEGAEPIAAQVRWAGDGRTGLHFEAPLPPALLEALIRTCRGLDGAMDGAIGPAGPGAQVA